MYIGGYPSLWVIATQRDDPVDWRLNDLFEDYVQETIDLFREIDDIFRQLGYPEDEIHNIIYTTDDIVEMVEELGW